MPKYNIVRNYGGCKGYSVIGESGTKGCHPTRAAAIQQQRALYASTSTKSHDGTITNEDTPNTRPHSLEECQDPKNCPDHMNDNNDNNMDNMDKKKKKDENELKDKNKNEMHKEDVVDKQSPCWDGYVQRGMKPGKDGQMVPNCVPAKKYIVDQLRPLF